MALVRWALSVLLLVALGGCGDNIKAARDGGLGGDADIPDAAGQIEFPDRPIDYEPGLIAYVDSITLPAVTDNVPECCRDFLSLSPASDTIDNRFAVLFEALDLVGVDLAQAYADRLDDGDLIWLIDHRGLDFRSSDTFTLAFLHGFFEGDTTVPDARSGFGTFTIDTARSFEPGTGIPFSAFVGTIYNRSLAAIITGRSHMMLPMAVTGGFVEIPLRSTRVRGEANPQPGGVEYTKGQISGYITEDDFYTALNDTLTNRCQCIAGDLPIFTEVAGEWSSDCPAGADVVTACDQPAEAICIGIAANVANDGACVFWELFSDQMDLDTDGDEELDALSVGLLFTAARGEVITNRTDL